MKKHLLVDTNGTKRSKARTQRISKAMEKMTGTGSLSQLEQALSTMYSNSSEADKKQATSFLESFQKSQEAWELTHLILNGNEESIQFKLFAAQTLRSKITYDLHQISEANMAQLKDSLIELIVKYPGHSQRIIRTQLCVALSQLALQYLSWSTAMTEVMSRLSQDESLIACLLDFLKILPEELSDVKRTSLTDDEFNARTQELITSNVEQVLMILKKLAESSNSKDFNTLILNCLNSWIKECPIENILQINSLTNLIFQSLTDDQTFDQSIECLCTIMRETRDIENHELIDALYQQLLQLNTYMTSNKEKLEDPETFSGLTRLYVEAGEAWHVLIVKNPKHFKPLVMILLECCKYEEDLDVVKYTFYFWYLLKQLLTIAKFHESKLEFQDVYSNLISIIIKHLTYPTSAEENNLFEGDREQEDKFKEFRYEMGDVLKDCCAVVGPSVSLNIPFQQIQSIMSNGTESRWQYLEAPLFSMRAMAKEVPLKEKTILPTIMNFLIQLPEHPKIRYAATLVLGRYTEWTSKNPDFLEPQLNYIIKGFEVANNTNNKEIIIAASHALMYFCQDCSSLLVNYLEQLYMLYGQVKEQLDIESTYELVDGLAHVIKQIPLENAYQTCEMFWKPTLSTLTSINTIGNNNDENVNVLIADQVEVLSTFITVLRCSDFEKPDHPICNLFIKEVWPVASNLLLNYGKSIKVSERILKLIKSAIQSFSTFLTPVLSDIANILHHGFQQTKFGCYLWVSGILIREFGDEYTSGEIKDSVYQFGLSQSSLFFELIKFESNLKNIPDVIEDFFRMMNDMLMFYPFKLIPNLDLLKSTLDASTITLSSIEQFEPLISCLHFLIDFISWGLPHPPISLFNENPQHIQDTIGQFLVMNDNGGNLIKVVLEGLIFSFHNDIQQDANDLLLKILIVVPDYTVAINWLSNVVKQLPNVNEKEVEKLIGTITVALPNKDNRRIRSCIKDFVNWYSRKNVSPRAEF